MDAGSCAHARACWCHAVCFPRLTSRALLSCVFVLVFAVPGIDRLPPTLRLLRCRSLDPVADRLAFCLAPFRLCPLHTSACAPCTCTAELVGRPKAALAAPPFPCRGEAFVLLLRVWGSSCATAPFGVGWAAPLSSPSPCPCVSLYVVSLSRLRCEPLSAT